MVELLGCYSNWTSWADRARSLPGDLTNRSKHTPPVRGTARRLTQKETSTLAKEYKAGATVYELAARFHIHRTTVSGHLHRLEVKMRRQGLDQRQLDQAAIFYALGWSVARIGRHFDVDGGTVWLALRAAGVQMRDTHGREGSQGAGRS